MSIGKQDLQELAQGLGEYQQKYALDLARTEAMMGDPSRLNALMQMQQPKRPKGPASYEEYVRTDPTPTPEEYRQFLFEKESSKATQIDLSQKAQEVFASEAAKAGFATKKEIDKEIKKLKENIKTIFKVWTEFTYENFTLGRNIYAAYILLAGKYNFQLMGGVYKDLDMELEKLGFSNKEREEFIGKFYFSIDELIIDLENENKNNINSKINDLILYLDNY